MSKRTKGSNTTKSKTRNCSSGATRRPRRHDKSWHAFLKIENRTMQFKLDTGAQANVIPLGLYQRVKTKNRLIPTSANLMTYNREQLPVVGQCRLNCSYKKKKTELLEFMVVDLPSPEIIGLKGCVRLQLLKRFNSIDSTSQVIVMKGFFMGLDAWRNHTILK